MNILQGWYFDNLVCPIDRTPLSQNGDELVSANGRRYPIVDGVPVLLVPTAEQTIGVARTSLARANGEISAIDKMAPELYLETLGIDEDEKLKLVELYRSGETAIDPVAIMLIGATCGNAYKHLIGSKALDQYPIPEIELMNSANTPTLLDIGCNWGRWSLAAARKGFCPVGIDPSLGAVMAARRIAQSLNLDIKFVVGDARFLPFRAEAFDVVYSYSVLQHLEKSDVRSALAEVSRVLKTRGTAKIQMANRWAVKSFLHGVATDFREPKKFEVRYWAVKELETDFSRIVGETKMSVDCFFGLGWQWCDFYYMSLGGKILLLASEALKRSSAVFPSLVKVADSVFCTSTKRDA
jgi:SAM-dependent methyltransferase/uncharacterized protein YbaR (Trm112 family)